MSKTSGKGGLDEKSATSATLRPSRGQFSLKRFLRGLSGSPHRPGVQEGGKTVVSITPSRPKDQTLVKISSADTQNTLGQCTQPPKIELKAPKLDLWKVARQRLERSPEWSDLEENVVTFEEQTCLGLSATDAVLRTIKEARDRSITEQWSFITLGGTQVVYRDVLSKMLDYVDTFSQIGGSLAAIDPTGHAPLAWGAVQFFVRAAINNRDVRDLILDQQAIAHKITRYSIFEQLYLDPSNGQHSVGHQDLRDSVIELYMRILKYQALAYKYLANGKLSHALKSFTTADHHPINGALDDIEKQVAIIDGFKVNEDRHTLLIHHRQLVKLLDNLNSPVLRVLNAIQDHLDNSTRWQILDWISTSAVEDHHDFVLQKALPGTGWWLQNRQEYLDWQSENSSSAFWLHGMMGSGKSTLLAILIQDMISQGSRVVYYYCSQTEETRRKELADATAVLRSIVRQLCAFGTLADFPAEVVSRYKSGGATAHLTQDQCIRAISSLLDAYPDTVIIMDALDEYNRENMVSLSNFLQKLYEAMDNSANCTKFIVSSRNNPSIENMLRRRNVPLFDVGIDTNDNQHDIHDYTKQKLAEYSDVGLLLDGNVSEDWEQDLVDTLVDMAQGMFKWVELSVQMVTGAGNADSAMQLLKTLPRGLEELYEDLYRSIERNSPADFEAVSRTLKWASCAELSLSVDAIREAIALELPDKPRQNWTRAALLRLCRNFVEEKNGCLRLAHQSVNEFLRRKEEFSAVRCHMEVARGCLLHLCYGNKESRAVFDVNGLPNYAACFWTFHYSAAKEDDSLQSLFKTFTAGSLSEETVADSPFSRWLHGLRANLLTIPDSDIQGRLIACMSDKPTALFAVCAFGLNKTLINIPKLGSDWVEYRNWARQSPLHVAAYFEHVDIVEYLLEYEHCPIEATDEKKQSALDLLMRTHRTLEDPTRHQRKQHAIRKLVQHSISSGSFELSDSIISLALAEPFVWATIFEPEGFMKVDQDLVDVVNNLENAHLLEQLFQAQPHLTPNTGSLHVGLFGRYQDDRIAISFLKQGADIEVSASIFQTSALRELGLMEAMLPFAPADADCLEVVENALWNMIDSFSMVNLLIRHYGKIGVLTTSMVNAASELQHDKSLNLILQQPGDLQIEQKALETITEHLPALTLGLALCKADQRQLVPRLIKCASINPNPNVLKQLLGHMPDVKIEDELLLALAGQLDVESLEILQKRQSLRTSAPLLKAAFKKSTPDGLSVLLDISKDFVLTEEACVEILEGASPKNMSIGLLEKLIAPPCQISGNVLGRFILSEAASFSRGYDLNSAYEIVHQEDHESMFELFFQLSSHFTDFTLDQKTKLRLLRESRELWPINKLLGPNFEIDEAMAEAVAENSNLADSVLSRWLQSDPEPTITPAIMKAAKRPEYNFYVPFSVFEYLLDNAKALPLTPDVLEKILPYSTEEQVQKILARSELQTITADVLRAAIGNLGPTMLALIRDDRLEQSEEIAMIVVNQHSTKLTVELLQRFPNLEITDRVLASAASRPDQLILLLPLWNGQSVSDTILRQALTPEDRPLSNEFSQSDATYQLVEKCRPIMLTQDTIKHIVAMKGNTEFETGHLRRSSYANLIYLVQRQNHLVIDRDLLDWVVEWSRTSHRNEDVYSALFEHAAAANLAPSTETLIKAIKNSIYMTESVIRRVAAEDWDTVVTEEALLEATMARDAQVLLRTILDEAPPSGLRITSKVMLQLLWTLKGRVDSAPFPPAAVYVGDEGEHSSSEDVSQTGRLGHGITPHDESEIQITSSSGQRHESDEEHRSRNDDDPEDHPESETDEEEVEWDLWSNQPDTEIDLDLIFGLLGSMQGSTQTETEKMCCLVKVLYKESHGEMTENQISRLHELLGLPKAY